MILFPRPNAMQLWAAGDVARHPWQSLLLFLALASLTTMVSLVLLLTQALNNTCDLLMAQTPMVVVRRVSSGGWVPMPVQEAVTCARNIAGVIKPRVRIWGVVSSAQGAVTVSAVALDAGYQPAPGATLQPGQAWIGPGVSRSPGMTDLTLKGSQTLTLAVTYQLTANSSMATHDVVMVHPDDARRLLGLGADQASDLVFDVYHEEEIKALSADLAAAFPWPVRVSTRREQERLYKAQITDRCSAGLLAVIPFLLSIGCLFAAQGVWRHRQRSQWGLLKALGWTSHDIVRLHVLRSLLVGGPALMCGLAAAYGLMFCPRITWIARMLFGWSLPAPALYLTVRGASGAMLLSLCLVGLPFLVAGFWAGWQGVTTEPADLLQQS